MLHAIYEREFAQGSSAFVVKRVFAIAIVLMTMMMPMLSMMTMTTAAIMCIMLVIRLWK